MPDDSVSPLEEAAAAPLAAPEALAEITLPHTIVDFITPDDYAEHKSYYDAWQGRVKEWNERVQQSEAAMPKGGPVAEQLEFRQKILAVAEGALDKEHPNIVKINQRVSDVTRLLNESPGNKITDRNGEKKIRIHYEPGHVLAQAPPARKHTETPRLRHFFRVHLNAAGRPNAYVHFSVQKRRVLTSQLGNYKIIDGEEGIVVGNEHTGRQADAIRAAMEKDMRDVAEAFVAEPPAPGKRNYRAILPTSMRGPAYGTIPKNVVAAMDAPAAAAPDDSDAPPAVASPATGKRKFRAFLPASMQGALSRARNFLRRGPAPGTIPENVVAAMDAPTAAPDDGDAPLGVTPVSASDTPPSDPALSGSDAAPAADPSVINFDPSAPVASDAGPPVRPPFAPGDAPDSGKAPIVVVDTAEPGDTDAVPPVLPPEPRADAVAPRKRFRISLGGLGLANLLRRRTRTAGVPEDAGTPKATGTGDSLVDGALGKIKEIKDAPGAENAGGGDSIDAVAGRIHDILNPAAAKPPADDAETRPPARKRASVFARLAVIGKKYARDTTSLERARKLGALSKLIERHRKQQKKKQKNPGTLFDGVMPAGPVTANAPAGPVIGRTPRATILPPLPREQGAGPERPEPIIIDHGPQDRREPPADVPFDDNVPRIEGDEAPLAPGLPPEDAPAPVASDVLHPDIAAEVDAPAPHISRSDDLPPPGVREQSLPELETIAADSAPAAQSRAPGPEQRPMTLDEFGDALKGIFAIREKAPQKTRTEAPAAQSAAVVVAPSAPQEAPASAPAARTFMMDYREFLGHVENRRAGMHDTAPEHSFIARARTYFFASIADALQAAPEDHAAAEGFVRSLGFQNLDAARLQRAFAANEVATSDLAHKVFQAAHRAEVFKARAANDDSYTASPAGRVHEELVQRAFLARSGAEFGPR